MSPLAGAALAVTVVIVVVWVARTVSAEGRAGRGQGQILRRGHLLRVSDLALWILGVAWFALLAVYFAVSLTGA